MKIDQNDRCIETVSHLKTLGILVNSDRYFDQVEKLTHAALQKGKRVRIHLWGDGLAMIGTKLFERLSQRVRITVCSESALGFSTGERGELTKKVEMISPGEMASAFQECHRHLVF